MELKVLGKSKNRIKLELKGEGHTFSNALRKELWNDKHVKAAAYAIDHPLVGNPVLIVETDSGENPKKALSAAINRLKKRNKEFQDKFKKAKL